LERAIGVVSLAVNLPVSDEMPLPAGCSKIAYIGIAGDPEGPGLGGIRGLDRCRGSNTSI
jgi:hypothetical protein